jgi:hypothetical protein
MFWFVLFGVIAAGLVAIMIATGWIARFYWWLLWQFGFRDLDSDIDTASDREMITYMLRRQVVRLKWLWWILSLGTLYGLVALTIMVSWWWLFGLLFLTWLFIHVLYPASFPAEKKRR